MSRRKTKETRSREVSACQAVILLDSRPIREGARKEYEKVLRDLDRARRELQQFEKHDQPHFSRWLHHQFGAVVTEIRETTKRLAAQRELLFEIESEAFGSECSFAQAYERVLREREEAGQITTNPQEKRNGEGNASGDPFVNDSRQHGGSNGNGGHEEHQWNSPHSAGRAPGSRNPPAGLKELYRALARRLHPDAQEQMSEQKKAWWHQAQAAYESGDIDQLQVILSLCEIQELGTTAKTSVSLLMRITRQFKASLRTLKTQLNQCRQNPAWNFSRQDDRSAIAIKTERLLATELADAKRALEVIELQLASWAQQSRAGRQRRSRRKSFPDASECPF